MILLESILILLCLSTLGYYLMCLYSASSYFGEPGPPPAKDQPPISILIPVRGVDHAALQNFESLCLQEYPRFEILFGVQDPADPVVGVIQQLKSTFASCAIRLIDCREVFGPNAKVSNLMTMFRHARYEHVLIIDSDIRVTPDYLLRIVPSVVSPGVGLVTCPYRAVEARTLAAKLEAVGISSDFIPGVLVARKMEGMRFGLGATMLTRKSIIEAIGGLAGSVDKLGDDFILGNKVAGAGYQVVLSRYVCQHVQPREGLASMLQHQLRWARSTKYSRPLGYVGLIFTQGFPVALALLLLMTGSPAAVGLAAATIALRFVVAIRIGVIGLDDRFLLRHLWMIPLRDLIHFGIWCYSFLGNRVVWRGRRFRLESGGRLIPLESETPAGVLLQLERD